MIYKITKETAGERLDKFLVAKLPQYSRSFLQKQIEEGLVLVNSEQATVHCFLKDGDKIETKFAKPAKIKVTANKKIKLDIIFEDKNYLVINKPAYLIVHQSEEHKDNDTLVNGLLAHCPTIKKATEDPLRPGIVHRLDKEASGLMVVAKTKKALEYFQQQFQDRKMKKEYLALVYGKISQSKGSIDFALGRSSEGKMSVQKDGREAKTEFEVLKEFPNRTLLKVVAKTGRMHQIRAHLNALSHPIIGDKVYKSRRVKIDNRASHLFLHAQTLGFYDMDNQWKEFTVLPAWAEEVGLV